MDVVYVCMDASFVYFFIVCVSQHVNVLYTIHYTHPRQNMCNVSVVNRNN